MFKLKRKREALKACGRAKPKMNLTGLKKYIQSDKDLLNDYDIGMKLLSNHGKFFSDILIGENVVSDLIDNSAFVSIALRRYSPNLEFVSKRLLNDKDTVIRAVSCGSRKTCVLRFASEEHRNDKSVLSTAIVKNPESILFSNLIHDEYYFFEAIKNCRSLRQIKTILCRDPYEQKMKKDDNFKRKAIKANGLCLSLCSEEDRNDKKLVLLSLSCEHSLNSFPFFGDKLKNDKDFMMYEVCKKRPSYIRYFPSEVINDPKIDKSFLLTILKSPKGGIRYFNEFHENIKNDFEFVCIAVRASFQPGGNYNFLFHHNFRFSSLNLSFLDRFVVDRTYALRLLSNFLPLKLVEYDWINDEEIILKAIEYNEMNLFFAQRVSGNVFENYNMYKIEPLGWNYSFLKKAIGANKDLIRNRRTVCRVFGYPHPHSTFNKEIYFGVLKEYDGREEITLTDLWERIRFLRNEKEEKEEGEKNKIRIVYLKIKECKKIEKEVYVPKCFCSRFKK